MLEDDIGNGTLGKSFTGNEPFLKWIHGLLSILMSVLRYLEHLPRRPRSEDSAGFKTTAGGIKQHGCCSTNSNEREREAAGPSDKSTGSDWLSPSYHLSESQPQEMRYFRVGEHCCPTHASLHALPPCHPWVRSDRPSPFLQSLFYQFTSFTVTSHARLSQ